LSLPFSLINEALGVEGTGYAARKFNGRIYLGTNTGAFLQKEMGYKPQLSHFELIAGTEGQAYNFSEVENKLILNHDRGAFELKGERLIPIQDIGSWKFMTTKISDVLMAGGYRGISFFRNQNDRWTKIGNIPDLDESIRIMEFENDSILWATHASKGIFRIKFDTNMNVKNGIEILGEKNGLPSKLNINVYSLNDQLVFTSEEGIYDFNSDSNSFTPNTYFNKWLGTDYVNQIISDKKNGIYYIQNQKFGELKQKKFGTYENESNLFKHINNYINDDLPNISILDANNIIIGAKEGFILYHPDHNLSINKNFEVLLRRLEIQTSAESVTTINPSVIKELKIKKDQPIKFEYAAPYFDGFEDLKYSYRLLPLNKNWSKWTSVSEKEYDLLPFDEYTFEVKSLDIYGSESSVSRFPFEVMTPWYATPAAKMAYVGFGLIAFILIPLIQRWRHKSEKIIITEKNKLELKMKDEQISFLANEKLQSELDHKNDQLTSTAMQLMKNNEFIQQIQEKISKTLNEGSKDQELRNIIKTIDKELSNNDSWDQFAYHFDQVHGNYLEKLSKSNIHLSPREIKLAAFLRMNMSSKEISKLLNITTRGVELARYRLRKKLKLTREQNLVEYLIDLDND